MTSRIPDQVSSSYSLTQYRFLLPLSGGLHFTLLLRRAFLSLPVREIRRKIEEEKKRDERWGIFASSLSIPHFLTRLAARREGIKGLGVLGYQWRIMVFCLLQSRRSTHIPFNALVRLGGYEVQWVPVRRPQWSSTGLMSRCPRSLGAVITASNKGRRERLGDVENETRTIDEHEVWRLISRPQLRERSPAYPPYARTDSRSPRTQGTRSPTQGTRMRCKAWRALDATACCMYAARRGRTRASVPIPGTLPRLQELQ